MPAAYNKTIICLANSWKFGGRCVAGKELDNRGFGEWVRPIGGRDGGALTFQDRQYQNGTDPALLDVIKIPMTRPFAHAFQPENHLIDDGWYWQLVRKATAIDLAQAIDPVQPDLWGTTGSSGSGLNDRVLENSAGTYGYSLRLIRVNDLMIRVSVESPHFSDKKKSRGFFTYSGNRYAFAITDPVTTASYNSKAEGDYQIGGATICVSLGEPFNGFCYKLIAGVFIG